LEPREPAGRSEFRSTRWSVVARAGRPGSSGAREALAWLFEAYAYPLYACARRKGLAPEDAEEAVAELFASALEKGSLAGADRERGRFRAYLLGALEHALANRRRFWRTLKRGGGRAAAPLDAAEAERRYEREPGREGDPARLFEAAWARAVIERAFAAVRAEYAARGDAGLFDALRARLVEDAGGEPYSELARKLATSEGALKVAVHRLRKRFRAALEAEIAETVADPAAVQDEIRHLFEALGR
jgi:RNA polymerase sigma-70 factor (ECF subfamily)